MTFKKNLLVFTVALLTLGFVACSDDENTTPEDIATTWTLSKSEAIIKTDNEKTKEAIENELIKSVFSVKNLQLNTNGGYESTLDAVSHKGVYKIENDSLHLIRASIFENTELAPEFVYGLSYDGAETMKLNEDITARFIDKFEDLEQVVITLNLTKEKE